MKEQEEIMNDVFLKEVLKGTPGPALSADFTAKVMQAVEAEAAIQALIYKPFISRRVWQRIGFGVGLLLLFPLIIGLITSTTWSELTQTLATFSLPENLKMPASGASSVISYIPKLAVITSICLIILLMDKLYQRFMSK